MIQNIALIFPGVICAVLILKIIKKRISILNIIINSLIMIFSINYLCIMTIFIRGHKMIILENDMKRLDFLFKYMTLSLLITFLIPIIIWIVKNKVIYLRITNNE